MGGAVASGAGFSAADPEGWRTPVYPAFVGFWRLIAGDFALQATILAQNLLGIATALLVARCAVLTCGLVAAGPIGYGLCVIGFGRLQWDQMLMSESLFAFLLTLHVLLTTRAYRSNAMLPWAAAGLALGLAALTRPAAALLAPVEVALLALLRLPQCGAPWRARACMLVASLLPMSAWMVRNSVVFGEFTLTRMGSASDWYHAFAPSGVAMPVPPERLRALPSGTDSRNGVAVFQALEKQGFEGDEVDHWMRAGVAEAKRTAGSAYWSGVIKHFFTFWSCNEEAIPFYVRGDARDVPGLERQALWRTSAVAAKVAPALRWLYRYPPWLLVFGAAMAGVTALYAARQTRPELRFVGLMTVTWMGYFAALTAVKMYPLFRYRAVIEPVMCLCVAVAVTSAWHRRRRHD